MMPNDQWGPLIPQFDQIALITSAARFRVVAAGRRSGKTIRAKRFVVRTGLRECLAQKYETYPYFFAAPTRDQAKAIYWDDLKRMIPPALVAGVPSETALIIKTQIGAEFHVVGMDKPERIEGRPWNGGVLDEFANMKPAAWPEHVRPALSDRQGWCWFIGVPEGLNHYYDLYRAAANRPDWAAFHWRSADILPAEEIESARQDLDDLTYQQEYEASFVNFQGRAYYGFDSANIRPYKYQPREPLAFCFDFNVSPGVACVAQEVAGGQNASEYTAFFDECWIERNSNTERIANMLAEKYRNHRGAVICYGDATGGARGSAKLAGSDWDIIRRIFAEAYGDRLSLDVPRRNPDERVRVNAVNARILAGDGTRRILVDPGCSRLIRDFEAVTAAEDGALEKSKNNLLTHISDAAGYYIARCHPIEARGVMQTTRGGR